MKARPLTTSRNLTSKLSAVLLGGFFALLLAEIACQALFAFKRLPLSFLITGFLIQDRFHQLQRTFQPGLCFIKMPHHLLNFCMSTKSKCQTIHPGHAGTVILQQFTLKRDVFPLRCKRTHLRIRI